VDDVIGPLKSPATLSKKVIDLDQLDEGEE